MNESTEALKFHASMPAGKVGVCITKDIENNMGLAYSPGVAEPCTKIADDPSAIYRYTNLGNRIAIISNGTAVLGLGNLGASASKPVLEGKCALFKILAGIDCVDIILDETDPTDLANQILPLAKSFSGIMLEDIAAPACFELERILQKELQIPVFHDDQHGTAVVSVAALLNSLKISGKQIHDISVVCLGAGAAGLACLHLMISAGVQLHNIKVFDSRGIIHKGRTDINRYKTQFVSDLDIDLPTALKGADVFLGTSVGNALKPEWIAKMAKNPLIMTLANPQPEIMPDAALQVRPDAMVCTGRVDFPNQVNNVFCFPYLFRVLLDYKDKLHMGDEIKLATARAIASLAPEGTLIPSGHDRKIRYLMPGLILKELGMDTAEVQRYNRQIAAKLIGENIQSEHDFTLNPRRYLDLEECRDLCEAWGGSVIKKARLSVITSSLTDVPNLTNGQYWWLINLGNRLIWLNTSGPKGGDLKSLVSEARLQCLDKTCPAIVGYIGFDYTSDTLPVVYYDKNAKPDYLAIFAVVTGLYIT